MLPVSFSDEEIDSLSALALPLPPPDRSAFLEAVASKLAAYPPESRGLGLVHRLGVEVQLTFVRTDQVAVGTGGGGKYSRGSYGRRERRRGSSA